MVFTLAFYKHIMFRHSCGACHFCNTRRPSDITIADFWRWEKTDPTINADNKGVSLILVNTEKGKLLFDAVSWDMDIIHAKLEDCLQTHLRKPSDIHPKRMDFERDYARYGFERTFRKYGLMGWRYQLTKVKGGALRMLRKIYHLMIDKRKDKR